MQSPFDIFGNAGGIFLLRIAALGAIPRQIGEMFLRRLAGRYRLVGIFIFEFVQRETAGVGDFGAAGDRFGTDGEERCHIFWRFEMALGIDGKPKARFGEGAFLADAGDDIGKRPAFRLMIEHIIEGDERRPMRDRRSSAKSRSGAAHRHEDDWWRRGRRGRVRLRASLARRNGESRHRGETAEAQSASARRLRRGCLRNLNGIRLSWPCGCLPTEAGRACHRQSRSVG